MPPANTPALTTPAPTRRSSYDVADIFQRSPTRDEVIDSYRQGVREDAYLAEAEGTIIAQDLGLAIPVYQDAFPEDLFEPRDMGGGSHCLIHALTGAATYLETGRPQGATTEEISRLRNLAANGLGRDELEAYAAVVLAATGQDGQGEPGLGAGLQAIAPQGAPPLPSTSATPHPIAQYGGDAQGDAETRVALLHDSRSNHYTLLIRRNQS